MTIVEYDKQLCSAWKNRFDLYKNNMPEQLLQFMEKHKVRDRAAHHHVDYNMNQARNKKFTKYATWTAVGIGVLCIISPAVWPLAVVAAGVAGLSNAFFRTKLYDKWVDFKAKHIWKRFKPLKYVNYLMYTMDKNNFLNLYNTTTSLDEQFPNTQRKLDMDLYMNWRKESMSNIVNECMEDATMLEELDHSGMRSMGEDYKTLLKNYNDNEQKLYKSYCELNEDYSSQFANNALNQPQMSNNNNMNR